MTTENDLRAFQARQEQQEPAVEAAFKAWIARILAALPVEVVETALATGHWEPILEAVAVAGEFRPNLTRPAAVEGAVAMQELPKPLGLELSFNMQDPNFERAVYDHGAWLIREIDLETRKAVQTVVANARRDGLHPRQFAPQITELVGLTTRQAVAVENRLNGMLQQGMSNERSAREATRYSDRLHRQRAMTISRTETIRAANIGRREAFAQAARNGLFNSSQARREWIAVQTDPKELCFGLNGTTVTFNQEFPYGDPPVHPNCKCSTWLVLI